MVQRIAPADLSALRIRAADEEANDFSYMDPKPLRRGDLVRTVKASSTKGKTARFVVIGITEFMGVDMVSIENGRYKRRIPQNQIAIGRLERLNGQPIDPGVRRIG